MANSSRSELAGRRPACYLLSEECRAGSASREQPLGAERAEEGFDGGGPQGRQGREGRMLPLRAAGRRPFRRRRGWPADPITASGRSPTSRYARRATSNIVPTLVFPPRTGARSAQRDAGTRVRIDDGGSNDLELLRRPPSTTTPPATQSA